MTSAKLTGHCLCGAFRFRFDPTDAVTDYCHCEMCRRWSGAPVTAWTQVPAKQFEVLGGRAKSYQSSAQSLRHFCDACGSPIYMSGGDTIGVMLGTVDDASTLAPAGHGWDSARLVWLHIVDDLPRWPEDAPYDREK